MTNRWLFMKPQCSRDSGHMYSQMFNSRFSICKPCKSLPGQILNGKLWFIVSARGSLLTIGEWPLETRTWDCPSVFVRRVFQFPLWARAQIVSPETGREVGEGETGLIQVLDLANVNSVLAIQTEDLGIRRGDGFEFVGRAAL